VGAGASHDTALSAVFGDDGALAQLLSGFRLRPQQLAMAEAVARTIGARGQLVAEAGTGTGKTFAYLVPALLYGGKVIISTGTKTLQDQLFERDLPLVRDALSVPVTIALLKGRANYVCLHYLERTAPWIERKGLEWLKAQLFAEPDTVKRLAARFRYSQKFMQDDPWEKRAAGERRDLHSHLATVRPATEYA